MEIFPSQPSYGTHWQWNSPSSDSEFYSMSSPETVSPDSAMDFGFSPSCLPCGPTVGDTSTFTGGSKDSRSPNSSEEGGHPGGKVRRTRSKNPSKQRQSASEKEKLRMRDLTKALNHLRTYLPPSVAPAGQSLTKIETLRLTIRYISHLSAQLGLSQEDETQNKPQNSPGGQTFQGLPGFCRYGSMAECWALGKGPRQHAGQYQNISKPAWPAQNTGVAPIQFSSTVSAQDDLSGMEYLLATSQCAEITDSCQMYSRDLDCQTFLEEFWI